MQNFQQVVIDSKIKQIVIHPKYDFYGASIDGFIYFRPAVRGNCRTGHPLKRASFWKMVHTYPVHAPYTPSYLRFKITSGKLQKMPTVHRFIMECFHGIKPKQVVVRHLDGDYLNNKVANLTYGTTQENVNDAVKHIGKYFEGTRNGRSKLTDNDVIKIRNAYSQGTTIKKLVSIYSNVVETTIRRIVNGKTWKHLL